MVRAVTRRPGNFSGIRVGWAGMAGGSTKSVCPVHLVDGCGLVVGRGGADQKCLVQLLKREICPRLVLDWAGTN